MLSRQTTNAYFTVAGQKLPVSHFSLLEAISRPSELRVSLHRVEPSWVGQPIQFTLQDSRIWHLMCDEIHGQTVVCRSAWNNCFTQHRTQRVFVQADLRDLVSSMIASTHWVLSHEAWEREQIVQCAENDGEFIQRICGRENIQFFARYNEQREILHFIDHPRFLTQRDKPLIYRPAQTFQEDSREGIFDLEVFQRGPLLETEWLEDQPLRLYSGIPCLQAGIRSAGMPVKSYQPLHYEPELLRKALQARMIHRNDYSEKGYRAVRLQSIAMDLAPGLIIDVASESGLSYAQGFYRVNYVMHEGRSEQSGEGATLRYHNRVIAQDNQSPWRGVLSPMPTMPLVFQANIESAHDLTFLNDKGRETVRSVLDTHSSDNTKASIPIPRLTPYAHANGGFQYPLYPGTEVLMTCLHGEADLPVILGSVYNEVNLSPVNNAQPYLNIIRSQQFQEIIFDDTPSVPSIVLKTQSGHEWLMRNKETPGFYVTCVGGMILRSLGTFEWHTGKSFKLWCGQAYTQKSAVEQSVKTHSGDIRFKSALEMKYHALNHIQYEAGKNMKTVCQDYSLKIENNQTISITQGDGLLNIQGASLIEVSDQIVISSMQGNLSMINNAGSCGIKLTPTGQIIIFGKKLIANTELQKNAGTIRHV
jgi:hypothetical protein